MAALELDNAQEYFPQHVSHKITVRSFKRNKISGNAWSLCLWSFGESVHARAHVLERKHSSELQEKTTFEETKRYACFHGRYENDSIKGRETHGQIACYAGATMMLQHRFPFHRSRLWMLRRVYTLGPSGCYCQQTF